MALSFLDYYLRAFVRPRRTFEQLLTDPRRLRLGVYFITIPAVLYTVIYIFLHAGGGAPSTFHPWLAIPKAEYYYYNRFLAAPSMYLCWLLSAGFIQLFSHIFGGKGSFEDMLAVLGLSTSIAMWGTMLHDLIMSFLGAIHVISLSEHEIAMNSPTIWRTLIWTCMIIYLVWFVLLFTRGTAAAQRINGGPAFLLGLAGFLIFQVVFLIFNR